MNRNIIEDNNIRLRLIDEHDIEQLRLWRNSIENSKYFFTNNYISSEEQKKWFQNYLEKTNDYMFVIEEKEASRAIGMVGIYNIDSLKHEAEIGRLLIGDKSYRGKGLGYKTILLVCKYATDYLELEKVYLEVLVSNTVAIQSYLKTGFFEVEKIIEGNMMAIRMEKKLIPQLDELEGGSRC